MTQGRDSRSWEVVFVSRTVRDPKSDIHWLIRWRRKAAPDVERLVAESAFALPESSLPAEGLREQWYPVLPISELNKGRPTAVRLLSERIVLFRDAQGALRGLEDRCPHRGAQLSIGWQDVYQVGTVTCRYHGMVFDGEGKCLAALADGPESTAPKVMSVRTYPVEERYASVWIYVGDKAPPPIEKGVPHLTDVMSGRFSVARYWDWPVNYLIALDNNADMMHPSFAHQTCAQFKDQKRWDAPTADPLDCGGVFLGFRGIGPPHRGKRSNNGAEWHVPGFNVFFPRPGEPGGSMFWTVPLDRSTVRMFRMASFGDRFWSALRGRVENWIMVSRLGRPDNIYYCNKGPDAALAMSVALGMSAGGLSDRGKEQLCRLDKGVVAARRMMEAAYGEYLLEKRLPLPLEERAPSQAT